jgi:hypothetical protein
VEIGQGGVVEIRDAGHCFGAVPGGKGRVRVL